MHPKIAFGVNGWYLGAEGDRAASLSRADNAIWHTHDFIALMAPQSLSVLLQAKISCILEARSHADTMAYVHVPFTWLEHGDTLGANASELEHYISLGHRELHSDDLPSDVPVHEKGHCHDWADSNPHLYELLRTDLKYKLQSNQLKLKLSRGGAAQRRKEAEVDIAVHIR